MQPETRQLPEIGAGLIIGAALIGAAFAAWNYFAPMTGVTGTPGALLVLVSSLLLAADGAVLAVVGAGALRALFVGLGILGVLGTLAAAWFLHAWWLMAATCAVAAGIGLDMLSRRRAR